MDSRARWAKRHPARVREFTRSWRKRNPDKWRAQVERHLKRVLEEQERVAGRPKPDTCEVCGGKGSSLNPARRIHFDHDHKTGAFRGWICDDCNKTLGNSRESVERLMLLARYLQ